MAKKVQEILKLQIPAGKANPSPPVGPALGQRGINIMEFCKAFNEKTKSLMGKPVPVVITVYKDKKFDLVINCDGNNEISKRYLYQKIIKDYASTAYAAIINHNKINNQKAIQIFTKWFVQNSMYKVQMEPTCVKGVYPGGE